jgi:drug/metabolite transporter (DMT)-like permease
MLALGLRLLAATCFSVMSILIKLASDRGVAIAEIILWRQALALPIILTIIAAGPGFAIIRTQRLASHAGRTVIGLTCMGLTFGTIALLPLAEATTISYATPIFATLISALALREPTGPRRWAAMIAGFVGVVIIAQPSGQMLDPRGLMTGLSAAFLVAVVSFQIRDLGRTEAALSTVFWFTILSTIGLMPLLPLIYAPHDRTTWLLLLGIGTLGGVAQVAMTSSLRYAPVSVVIGMDYVSIIWSTLAGWLLWQHLPAPATWIGAPLIIGSGLYIVWREHQLALERSREVVA